MMHEGVLAHTYALHRCHHHRHPSFCVKVLMTMAFGTLIVMQQAEGIGVLAPECLHLQSKPGNA